MIDGHFAIQKNAVFFAKFWKAGLGFGSKGLTYNYLNTPIIFKYYPTALVNLHTGPQIGILIGGDALNGVSIIDDANQLEVGFAFGTEVYLTETVSLSARYVLGVSDIYDAEGDDHHKNRNIQSQLLFAL